MTFYELFKARHPLEVKSRYDDWRPATPEVEEFIYLNLDPSRVRELAGGILCIFNGEREVRVRFKSR
ncbi:hypothetical protein [Thauera sinica]|uniref:Uncharacterized protein n=1 Tax=Thauera sinica TaxID=2665146 RepID=A0ABW1AXY3_9RHOO|nr:hypothetical protein [Thauera sp. K11]ATE60134.1 hypothetical protein CCZ27_09405 [Thauera sp. K11]